jgi:hypothetical protein
MRTIVVAAILLLGSSSAWPEPEHDSGQSVSSPVGSESSIVTGNHKPVAAVPPLQVMEPSPATATPGSSGAPAPSGQGTPAPANAVSAPPPTAPQAQSTPAHSLDDVCNTLFTSAQDNDLPVAFFANLIWQESRLRDNAVSPKGAMGIAQFMPKVAAESGLENPFDPSQALPASAKLLRELFDQFGNLGYVAAAYNAGAQRVLDWLERGRSLPRETRGYVMNITGRSVEAWRKTPPDEAALRFARRLPCRGLPAFAELEQAQAELAQAKQAELARNQAEQAQAKQAELTRKQAEQAQAKQAELTRKQAEQAQAKQAELTRKQAEQAQAKQAELTRKQAERAQAKQKAKPERKQAKLARAKVSTQHVATQHAPESQRKTASRLKTAGRPQKVANAPAAKLSEKHVRLAKEDHSHKPIRREEARSAKRERPHVAKEHTHHAQRERHRRA